MCLWRFLYSWRERVRVGQNKEEGILQGCPPLYHIAASFRYDTGMDELVDIVDSECTVLSCATKSEAHQKGLLHRTVIAEVRDSKGNWILVQQSADRQDAGQYVSPVGGHVRAGESDEDALKRETLEEIGLTDFDFVPVGKLIYE